ncbi:MAG TPA: hypothetical protein VJN95_08870 [Gemmatimonadales bacterium]|nr:hypothetical protein [Gemmatimonadales bacterium]
MLTPLCAGRILPIGGGSMRAFYAQRGGAIGEAWASSPREIYAEIAETLTAEEPGIRRRRAALELVP